MIRLKRIIPAPLLSASLFALWAVLARSASPGHLLIALVLSISIPLMTVRLRRTNVRVRRPLVVARFIMRVGHDVLMSNLEVAWGIVAWRWRRPRAGFVIVPLDLRDPTGLAALSMVTTVVPGTVWSELALDRSTLLLHVWDVRDESAFVKRFKARYEKPLQEIFE